MDLSAPHHGPDVPGLHRKMRYCSGLIQMLNGLDNDQKFPTPMRKLLEDHHTETHRHL